MLPSFGTVLIGGGVLLLTGTLTAAVIKMYRELWNSDVIDETNHVVETHGNIRYCKTYGNVTKTSSLVTYSYIYNGKRYYENMFYDDDVEIESDGVTANIARYMLDEGAGIDTYNMEILESKARNDYIRRRRNMCDANNMNESK